MSRRGRPWSWRRRLAWRRAKWLREVEARVDERTHVEPCPECGSTQLCRPDCWIAPWNQYQGDIMPRGEVMPKQQLVSTQEIRDHVMLDDNLRKLARIFRATAKKRGDDFTMLDFAQVSLRAEAQNYVNAANDADFTPQADDTDPAEHDHAQRKHALADLELRKAAVRYVYEALKRCDVAIVAEYPDLPEALDLLYWLQDNLP